MVAQILGLRLASFLRTAKLKPMFEVPIIQGQIPFLESVLSGLWCRNNVTTVECAVD